MRPYLGVSCLVFSARKSAFSAPRIWTVEACAGGLLHCLSIGSLPGECREEGVMGSAAGDSIYRFDSAMLYRVIQKHAVIMLEGRAEVSIWNVDDL